MLPDATVTTDMIVGFPGETDVDFADTLSLVDDAGFLKVHTFIFSARKGTAAFDFKDRVPAPVAKERSAILREFAEKRSEDVKKEFIGHHADVLFEQKEKNGLLSGYSKEYIRVFMPCDESFINRIVPVKIKKLHADGVYADSAL
jgi:threonylcarbamoyladenosine tRNA methylthiotransferase MtaB